MIQFNNNVIVRIFTFNSFAEYDKFIKRIGDVQTVFIKDSYGDFYYCLAFLNALSGIPFRYVFFSCDDDINELLLMQWNKYYVVKIQDNLYFLNNQIVKYSNDLPINCLYTLNNRLLMVIEERSVIILNDNLERVGNYFFDFINDYKLLNNILYLQTDTGERKIDLNDYLINDDNH